MFYLIIVEIIYLTNLAHLSSFSPMSGLNQLFMRLLLKTPVISLIRLIERTLREVKSRWPMNQHNHLCTDIYTRVYNQNQIFKKKWQNIIRTYRTTISQTVAT